VNAGDGMFALAHVTLHRPQAIALAPERLLAATRLLDQASLRLCEGQYQDLAFEQQAEVSSAGYLDMVGGKTAALMAAAAASGALAGDASDEAVASFQQFGENLGFAFQIRDDVLGIWGEASETGKPTEEDIRARKKSFPIVHAFERASAADRAALRAIYERQSLDSDDVAVVLRILDRTRARADSRQAAARYAARALANLEGLDLVPDRRRDLETLADYFVNREA
jgi:geranylgeranyl diphosphate synthase type I